MLVKLKQIVSDKKTKAKLVNIIQICLNHVEMHPEDIKTIGIAWYDNTRFILNAKIFGNFIRRKPNSFNRLLRTKGCSCDRSKASERGERFKNLPDAKYWYIRQSDLIKRKQLVDTENTEKPESDSYPIYDFGFDLINIENENNDVLDLLQENYDTYDFFDEIGQFP